jgi:Dolichyl-phosphate-mannose-protein mannosyltransferase
MRRASETWRRLSPAWRWGAIVALGCLVMAAIHGWWVLEYRHGYPFNVDEYGYTGIAVNDWLALETHGLHAWWEMIQTQTPNAPLLPAITSLVLLVKPGVLEGFGVLILFGILLTLATYGIGERLAGPRLGALAALAVATAQGTFLFTREYIFALPTAAFLACAIYSLLRSDGMRSRLWSVLCGASIGLMLLSRTMSVAFVPGIAVVAVLMILVRRRDDFGLRLLNLGLSVVAAFLVAITWYWRNLDPVVEYLTSFGYGSEAQYFGSQHAVVSWGRFKSVLDRMIQSDLLVPLFLLVLAGLVALGVLLVLRLRDSDDRRAELWHLAGSDVLGVFLIFAAGFAALMTSQNGGNGFTYPIAMILPPLAVASLRYLRAAAIPVAVLVGAIAVLNLAASSALWESASKVRNVAVPTLGELPWVSGEAHAVASIRPQVPGPLSHFTAEDEGWPKVDRELADILLSPIAPEGRPRLVAFASRNRVVSTNSVGLEGLLYHHEAIPFTQLLAEPGDTVPTYERQLQGPEIGEPTVVITTSTEAGDFEPLVTQKKVEIALRHSGFGLIREVPMPDGRSARVWVKGAAKSQSRNAAAPAARASGNRRG